MRNIIREMVCYEPVPDPVSICSIRKPLFYKISLQIVLMMCVILPLHSNASSRNAILFLYAFASVNALVSRSLE